LHGGRFDRSGQRLFRSSGRSATTTSDRCAPCPAGDYSDWPARYSDERIGRGFPRTPRRRACPCGTPGLPSGRGGIRTCQSCPPRPDGWCLLHRPGHFDRAGRKHASAAPSCTVLNSTNSLPVLLRRKHVPFWSFLSVAKRPYTAQERKKTWMVASVMVAAVPLALTLSVCLT
jgi:hypothetical protein